MSRAASATPTTTPPSAAAPTGASPTGSTPQGQTAAPSPRAADHVEEELLVEEVSIDGMCGVY